MTASSKPSGPAGIVVVGAGPVGLVLACELGRRGIRVRLVEQAPGLQRHPRANTMSARTMETFRSLGIAGRVRQAAPIADDQPVDVGFFGTLLGTELHRVPLPSAREALAAARAGDPAWPTPEPTLRATQMVVEPILLEKALSYPSVSVHFGHRFTGLKQDAAGVDVSLDTHGGAALWRCTHLVGCDGGTSAVRRALGIRFEGESGLSMRFMGGRMLATHFRSPELRARFPHPPTWMHYTMRPSARSVMVSIDPAAADYLLHVQLSDDEPASEETFLRRLPAVAGASVACEIQACSEWRAGRGLVAEAFGAGRVFLAGDAVHLFTPTGGFGMNTGIEDAVNLGWKLALVEQGHAPPALLRSYTLERQPVARRNVGIALDLARNAGLCPVSDLLEDPGPAGSDAREQTRAHLAQYARLEFETLGVQLGARYDSSPIVLSDGRPAPRDTTDRYLPSTVPGGLLPHRWLADGQALQDVLGPGFTLVHPPAAEARRWVEAAAARHLPFAALAVDPSLGFGDEALLVRPDRHIAWAGTLPADPDRILAMATGRAPADP